jgi:hypothetical protein
MSALAFDAKPRLSMSGFIKACIRRQRDDFRVRKSGCKRVANPRAPAGAIREAIAPYGRYSAASSPKVQSTGYLDTIQNIAAVALPMPIVRGARRPAKGLPRSAVYFNDVRVRSSIRMEPTPVPNSERQIPPLLRLKLRPARTCGFSKAVRPGYRQYPTAGFAQRTTQRARPHGAGRDR